MKQMLIKRKKTFFIALALVLLAVVGVTIAYYASTKEFSNEFTVGKPGVAVEEKFNPADKWEPGEDKEKIVIFRNTGELDMLLRFTVSAAWAPGQGVGSVNAGDCFDLYWNTAAPAGGTPTDDAEADPKDTGTPKTQWRTKNDAKIKDFQKIVGTDGTVYYYYTKILPAGESTDEVLKSVKFHTDLTNDEHGTKADGTQINLTVKGETVLVDKAAAEAAGWAVPTIHEDGTVSWTGVSGAASGG